MKKQTIAGVVLVLSAIAIATTISFCTGSKPRQVILISIDTCRADYLGCYGREGGTTPEIDRFAEDSRLFQHAVSSVPLTLPSHCSIMTGTTPASHGLHDNFSCLGTSAVTLADILKEDGFKTAGIVSAVVLESQFGLAQGFDTYDDTFRVPLEGNLGGERRGDETTDVALEWLTENKDSEFFLFVHYFDPHAPYNAPEPYASRFPDDPYAADIAFTDGQIGRLFAGLKELDIYDDALVVLVGDHGEMLGEHGEPEHGFFIYASAVNVPMIMKMPRQSTGEVSDDLAGLVDVAPTICAMLGIESPKSFEGRNLFNSEDDPAVYIESVAPAECGANPLLGIVTRDWKYISGTTPELFDLVIDPAETMNVAPAEAGIVSEMEQRLIAVLDRAADAATHGVGVQLDPHTKQQLMSLGYTAGSAAELKVDRSKPDAADLIQAHVTLQETRRLIRIKGAESRVKTMLNELLKEHPELHEVHIHLGDIATATGDLDTAISCYNTAAALMPSDHETYLKRASAFARSRQADKAMKDYSKAIELAPGTPGIWCGRADFRRTVGDLAGAARDCGEAININPRYVDAWLLRGDISQSAGNLEGAEADYSKALELRPAMPELWYNRAHVRNQLGDSQGAQADLAQALRVAPQDWPHRTMVQNLLKE